MNLLYGKNITPDAIPDADPHLSRLGMALEVYWLATLIVPHHTVVAIINI